MSQLISHPAPAFPITQNGDQPVLYPEGTLTQSSIESAIRQYFRIFFKYRLIIIAAAATGLILALAITLLTAPEYTAKLRLQVSREAPKVVDVAQADGEDVTGSSIEFYQTQYALLKSRSLSEAVVRDLNLANDPVFLADFGGRSGKVTNMPVAKRMEVATSKVNDDTIVAPVRGSSIIDVEYSARNPQLAARVANSIGENFIESNLARRFEAAAYARDFLQKKLDQTRAKLEESERKAVAYAQQQGLINIKSGSADQPTEQSLVATQLGELSTQLTTAHAARVQAEAQFRSGAAGTAAAQALSSTTLNELRSQRAQLLGQLSKVQSDFGPEYPPVIALRSQIAELDRQIGGEQARVSSSVAQDLGGRFRQALAAERDLQARVESLKTQLLGEEGRSIQFNILQRDVDTNRGLYEALLQRFKEVGIAGGVGTNNVSVVDQALTPDAPSSPKPFMNLSLGLLAGLIAGAVAALILDQLAESVILPREFQNKLNVPLLGSTPITKEVSAPKLLTSPNSDTLPSDASLAEAESELAEAYYSVLTAVQFSTADGAPKSIAVTSTQAREGKSTTAMALARGLASNGARVLLVDADMRNPSLHRSYDLPREKGLSDVLTGHADLQEVIKTTKVERLSLITSGKIPPNPAELLGSMALTRTLRAALELFDHVIFDSPPVLGLADAPLVARAAEGTVFVIEAGRTRATQARHALDRLMGIRAHIVGAVLTKLDSTNAGYGYGYGYTYKYGDT